MRLIDSTYGGFDDVFYATKSALRALHIPESWVDMEISRTCIYIRFTEPGADTTTAIVTARTGDLPYYKSSIVEKLKKAILSEIGGLCDL